MEKYEIPTQYANGATEAQQQQTLLQEHTMTPTSQSSLSLKSWFDFKSSGYLKGLLIGAGVAAIVGHPKIRKAIISSAVNAWDSVTGGVEELKEQIHDVRAEKNIKEN